MRPIGATEFPPEQQAVLARARRLEWWTLAYTLTAVGFLYLTMGASQAMRTSFLDDVISLIPGIAFLVCTRLVHRRPTALFPYGLHGAVSIGYLVASLALLSVGLLLLYEAAEKLLTGERTTIGGLAIFGHTIWGGWPMLLALAYAAFPRMLIGRAKLEMAPKIHDKILFAEAQMMKADWMAEGAAAIGVLGVGFGYWWADPLAAALVSLDILKDGGANVAIAVSDLIERRPMKTDRSAVESLPDDLRQMIEGLDWVERAEVRLRETGHIFIAEVFIKPSVDDDLPRRAREARDMARGMNWRLHDVTVSVLDRLSE